MKVYCPECESACSESDAECWQCGHALQQMKPRKDSAAATEPVENDDQEQPEAVSCPSCGFVCDMDDAQCGNCEVSLVEVSSESLDWKPSVWIDILRVVGVLMLVLGVVFALHGVGSKDYVSFSIGVSTCLSGVLIRSVGGIWSTLEGIRTAVLDAARKP